MVNAPNINKRIRRLRTWGTKSAQCLICFILKSCHWLSTQHIINMLIITLYYSFYMKNFKYIKQWEYFYNKHPNTHYLGSATSILLHLFYYVFICVCFCPTINPSFMFSKQVADISISQFWAHLSSSMLLIRVQCLTTIFKDRIIIKCMHLKCVIQWIF